MARLFGTDGVRGIANTELGCTLAYRIGQAGAELLMGRAHRARILIARDTRISGNMLFSALSAGICSVGAEAVDLGVLPTPGAAHMVRAYGADGAVVVSASHNSYEYNGIKWFDSQGYKLPDEVEDRIEALVRAPEREVLPTGRDIGRNIRAHNAAQEYLEGIVDHAVEDISSFKVVLDCANGAASAVAPDLFWKLGATTFPYFNSPDGVNINADCGSTHPEQLQKLVLEQGADVGFAFDGDADRLICVDEWGKVVDGDIVMAICALNMKESGTLARNTLVATVMSNLGMIRSLEKHGIQVVQTDVGDRYVLECMREKGYNFGGEQSGHMIFLDENTTGDGLLSAMHVISIMARTGKSLSELAEIVTLYPQILINVQVGAQAKGRWQEEEEVTAAIREAEGKMGDKGRVLVRASGTEPLLRVMLEGEDARMIEEEADRIVQSMVSRLGGEVRR